MLEYQREFIRFAIAAEVLRFGEFTLKSGRISPYFFNAGLFNDGESLARLGEFYADAIVSTVAIALHNRHQINKPWTFNRKEVKAHGEGGSLVGAPLEGRVLVIDDVITAGTAIRESLSLIQQNDATLAGVCVSIDRQERGLKPLSAIQEIESDYKVRVITIAQLATLVEYLEADPDLQDTLSAIKKYQAEYGVG